MTKKIGIYVITNKINNKQYVGQSTNLSRRWSDHRSKSRHPRKPDEYRNLLYIAIREYGLENFSFEILEECDVEELNEREIFWIKKLNTYIDGYNNTPGGNLPCETQTHHLTDHGKAVLSIGEVEMCRIAYKEGKSSREMYDNYFKHKMSYDGFLCMWHGKNWKEVMPEVFNHNPRPAKKVTIQDIDDIRKKYDNGQSIRSISREYKGKLGYCTIYNIATRKTYKDGIHYKSDVSTIPLVGK